MSVADGKGGHQRLVPMSSRFFAGVAAYLDAERPTGTDIDTVFVVLKGPHRGEPLTAKGLEHSCGGRGSGPRWTTPPATSSATPV